MPRSEVIEAMALASTSFVGLMELNEKVGEYIAQVTGAEAGMIVSGAAGGVVLSIAACMTGKNVGFVRQLPDTTGMKTSWPFRRYIAEATAICIRMLALSSMKLVLLVAASPKN